MKSKKEKNREHGLSGAGRSALYFTLTAIFIFLSILSGELNHSAASDKNNTAAASGYITQGSEDTGYKPYRISDDAGSGIQGPVNQQGIAERIGSMGFHPDFTIILMTLFIALTVFSLKKQISRKNSALKMSEEKFRLIFRHSPLGILHFDREGVITECNASFEKIAGSKREKLLGLDIKSLPDIRAAQAVKHVLSGNTGTYEDIYTSITSEKTTPVRAILAPLIRENGTITGGIGIVEDVTLWKIYEERLVSARESAEKANRTKSIFLANMSHEVRTPLNGILGILQILRKSCDNPGHHEYIDMAMKSGRRLTRLLSDILDLTKIESEQFTLIDENVSVADIIASVKDSLSGDCMAKNISLTYDITEAVPEYIRGDELRIRQVLQNLVENSVKFTSDGTISIRADFIRSGDSEGILSLNVTDTGIGIENGKLAEILEPFRQVENSYTRQFQGAGLGLSIVRRLVELMKGEIKIHSTPGKGTGVECTMSVGICEDLKNKEYEKPADETLCIKPMRILLVEDDRINSLMVRRLLEKKNHTVTDASNGIEALDCFENAAFDLVLMDIQMPEMNGIEAIREIRKPERFGSKSGVCAIALTAYAMAGDRERFLEAGFNEYLPKPVDMEDLDSAILRLNPGK